MYHIVNKEKHCQMCTCPVQFDFTILFCTHFCKNKKPSNILGISGQWKMMSDFNTSHGKMFDFVSFPLFGCTLVI